MTLWAKSGLVAAAIVFAIAFFAYLPATPQMSVCTACAAMREPVCKLNLGQIYVAMNLYAADNCERFPPQSKWEDLYHPYAKTLYMCPEVRSSGYSGYAIVSGSCDAPLFDIDLENQRLKIFAFETSKLGRNVVGDLRSSPQPPRHREGNYMLLADGSIQCN